MGDESLKNKKITRKITQGMYVLTTNGGGCIVDAVSQVSAEEQPMIAVAVMKKNYTNELLHKNTRFALSVLGKKGNPSIIETFGFHSMREFDKFENTKMKEVEGVSIIKESLGYMVCEVVDKIENETHTIFLGRMIEADVFSEEEPMSYAYYQEHKGELLKVTTEEGKTAWVCSVCGYVYYGEELPMDFKCPVCGVDRTLFNKK